MNEILKYGVNNVGYKEDFHMLNFGGYLTAFFSPLCVQRDEYVQLLFILNCFMQIL